jgi:hypothetical protein
MARNPVLGLYQILNLCTCSVSALPRCCFLAGGSAMRRTAELVIIPIRGGEFGHA